MPVPGNMTKALTSAQPMGRRDLINAKNQTQSYFSNALLTNKTTGSFNGQSQFKGGNQAMMMMVKYLHNSGLKHTNGIVPLKGMQR